MVVSEYHTVVSQAVTPALTCIVKTRAPIPIPWRVTEDDPVRAWFDLCVVLIPSKSDENPPLTLLAAPPAVTSRRKLLATRLVCLQAKQVSAYHLVASQAVDPILDDDVRSPIPIEDP